MTILVHPVRLRWLVALGDERMRKRFLWSNLLTPCPVRCFALVLQPLQRIILGQCRIPLYGSSVINQDLYYGYQSCMPSLPVPSPLGTSNNWGWTRGQILTLHTDLNVSCRREVLLVTTSRSHLVHTTLHARNSPRLCHSRIQAAKSKITTANANRWRLKRQNPMFQLALPFTGTGGKVPKSLRFRKNAENRGKVLSWISFAVFCIRVFATILQNMV